MLARDHMALFTYVNEISLPVKIQAQPVIWICIFVAITYSCRQAADGWRG